MSGPQEQMSSSGFGSSSSLLRGRRFYCREWALDKLRRCLDARSGPGQAPGILVTGGPGAGKTALCTEVVSPTSKAGLAVGLAQRCLAAHFCQREEQTSIVLWRFVLGLVEQLRASPLLSPGYEELLNSPSVSSALEPLMCQRDPNETFKRFVPCLFCLFVFFLCFGVLQKVSASIFWDQFCWNTSVGNFPLLLNEREKKVAWNKSRCSACMCTFKGMAHAQLITAEFMWGSVNHDADDESRSKVPTSCVGKAVYQIPKSMKTGRRSPGTAARCCCISGLFEYLVLNVAVNRSCIYNDVICLLSTCWWPILCFVNMMILTLCNTEAMKFNPWPSGYLTASRIRAVIVWIQFHALKSI